MREKYACVLDAEGFYKTLVLLLGELGEEQIQYYTLQEGERLLEREAPNHKPYADADGFIKPKWSTQIWVEGATAEEISAWERQHPAPEPTPPTSDEINAQAIAELSLLQAQQAAEINAAVAELSILIAGGTANV